MDKLKTSVTSLFPDMPGDIDEKTYFADCLCGAKIQIEGLGSNEINYSTICAKCGAHINTFDFKLS